MSTADILDGAAADIMTFGWLRGPRTAQAYDDRTKPRCAIVAINVRARHETPDWYRAAIKAQDAFQAEVGETGTLWNDDQRDRRKVVRALRRTARKLRGASR